MRAHSLSTFSLSHSLSHIPVSTPCHLSVADATWQMKDDEDRGLRTSSSFPLFLHPTARSTPVHGAATRPRMTAPHWVLPRTTRLTAPPARELQQQQPVCGDGVEWGRVAGRCARDVAWPVGGRRVPDCCVRLL